MVLASRTETLGDFSHVKKRPKNPFWIAVAKVAAA
jgi:hypothetical protein